MPIKEYNGPPLDNPTAIHLHHTDISNCSDRVRIALSEKQLPWVSHFYSLPNGDHLTDAFFELNPRGVVPVLVHNGLVVTESNEIIEYLDDTFPAPPLRPNNPELKTQMNALLEAAADFHIHIAVLSVEFLFSVKPYSEEFFQKRAKYHGGGLGAMASQIYDPDTFTAKPDTIRNSISEMKRVFSKLNSMLENGGPWLLGEQFTLADISWAVQIHRLNNTGLNEIQGHPSLNRWHSDLEMRKSVIEGMLNWQTPEAYVLFSQYIALRRSQGTDINAPCWRQ